jgi:cyanophycinase
MSSSRFTSDGSRISFRMFQRRVAKCAENREGFQESDSAMPGGLRVSALRTVVLLLALMVAASACLFGQDAPKGNLIIIGGGNRGSDVMKPFIQLAGGEKSKIAYFPMASVYGDTMAQERIADMKSFGAASVLHLSITRQQADSDSILALLDGVTGVYFGGGDQSRLTGILKGTRTEKRIHELYRNGAVLGGTSAGAAVMSLIMLTGDEKRPTRDSSYNKIELDNIVTTSGFGFVDDAIVDQHFLIRRRSNRLISAVLDHPDKVGIGIDEATAIWVKPDHTFEVLGKSVVLVFDPTKSEVRKDAKGYGVRASDIRMSVLRSGSIYDLKSKKVIRLSN